MFLSRGDRDLGVAFQTHRRSQAWYIEPPLLDPCSGQEEQQCWYEESLLVIPGICICFSVSFLKIIVITYTPRLVEQEILGETFRKACLNFKRTFAKDFPERVVYTVVGC